MLDKTDEALLDLLRRNARLSIAELARELGVARSTAKDRLERLEQRSVIAGYTVTLGDDHAHSRVRAHVMIKLATHLSANVTRLLRAVPQITRAYAVSGTYDLIVVVDAAHTGELDNILDRIRELEGIVDTLTSIVLSTKFER
ncbi:MAG: Lrp/AsnC family transcriptional regulator [Pseudomonadota bacterium]